MASLNGERPRRLVLNVANRLATPQLGFDTVVQADFELTREGVGRLPAAYLPAGEGPRFRRLELYQTKAARAARRASEDAWVDALTANPLVASADVAKALVGEAKELYGSAAPILGGEGAPAPSALS
jgi:alpha-galactosidase/6-phospho-beta-glucosidase family protein